MAKFHIVCKNMYKKGWIIVDEDTWFNYFVYCRRNSWRYKCKEGNKEEKVIARFQASDESEGIRKFEVYDEVR